jgi:hypothetical protein
MSATMKQEKTGLGNVTLGEYREGSAEFLLACLIDLLP